MNDRDSENCIHKVNGACNSWGCKFEPKSGIYRPCSKCHNEECVFMGSSDTHSLCEDFEPKQKIGRWISFGAKGEIDGQIVRTFTCSECGAISIFRVTNGNIVNGDLCPNCGAKMEVKE